MVSQIIPLSLPFFLFSLTLFLLGLMNALRAFRDAYNRSYNKRPIFTLCVTNCVLGAISDSLAQGITYYDYRKNHKRFPEIMDKQLPENVREHEDLWPPPPAYDPFRTVRFAFYNFCIAPIVGKWYMVLDRYFPMPAAGAALASTRAKDIIAIKRMVRIIRPCVYVYLESSHMVGCRPSVLCSIQLGGLFHCHGPCRNR